MRFRLHKHCLLLALTCLVAFSANARTLQQVLSSGELRVGITLTPPWALRDADRELKGFEVDVAQKLAADMDVEIRFMTYDASALIRALESDQIDLIAAGLTISPARALHVNFSQPYGTGGIGIATNIANTAEVARLEEFDSPAFTIAVQTSSVAADLAGRLFPRADIRRFNDGDLAADALISGDVDVYLEEEPIPSFLALENPREVDVPVNEPLITTPWAFAVAKGDPDFVFFLNAWIEARQADTWLPTTYEYWFKSLAWRD
jgi:polar amino acid transport system substrate-binding protein